MRYANRAVLLLNDKSYKGDGDMVRTYRSDFLLAVNSNYVFTCSGLAAIFNEKFKRPYLGNRERLGQGYYIANMKWHTLIQNTWKALTLGNFESHWQSVRLANCGLVSPRTADHRDFLQTQTDADSWLKSAYLRGLKNVRIRTSLKWINQRNR